MKVNRTFAYVLSAAGLLVGGAVFEASSAQDRTQTPGQPTQGRVWIQNRGSAEAVPVSIQNTTSDAPLRVQLVGAQPITIGAGSIVQTRAVRQAWDYRSVAIAAGQDPVALLTGAGDEGWEAIGLAFTTGGGTVVLMKRPR
jgi:hypothetical protein